MTNQVYLSVDVEDWEWARALADKERLGIEVVDFMRPSVLESSLSATIESWRVRIGQLKTTPSVLLHGPFYDLYPASRDPQVSAIARARYTSAMDAAREIGAWGVIFHSGYLPCITNPSYQEHWVQSNAAFWSDFASDYPGITVLVENMWDPSPQCLRDLCRNVARPNFGICFDIAHAFVYSDIRIEEWLSTLGDEIKHVHVSDNHGAHDEELPLGEGKILFSVLKQRPERTGLTIEVIGRNGAQKSLEVLRKSGVVLEAKHL